MDAIFEFKSGGDRDGAIYDTNSDDKLEQSRAEHLWMITDGGQMGCRVEAPAEYAIQEINEWRAVEAHEKGALRCHWYKVVERLVDGDVVLVRLDFDGIEPFRDE